MKVFRACFPGNSHAHTSVSMAPDYFFNGLLTIDPAIRRFFAMCKNRPLKVN